MQRPVIDNTFKELQEKRKDQSVEAAERRREERSIFLHQELMYRLRTATTHERTGDLGIAKFKSTSEIPANNVSAHTSSGTQASVTAEIDIYKPLWLRQSAGADAGGVTEALQPTSATDRNEIQPQVDRRTSQGVPDSRRRRQRQSSRSPAQGWLGVLVSCRTCSTNGSRKTPISQ